MGSRLFALARIVDWPLARQRARAAQRDRARAASLRRAPDPSDGPRHSGARWRRRGAQGGRLELPLGGISLETVQREVVLAALRQSCLVQNAAAELIGVSARKLNYMIARMSLTHRVWRRNRAESPAGQRD